MVIGTLKEHMAYIEGELITEFSLAHRSLAGLKLHVNIYFISCACVERHLCFTFFVGCSGIPFQDRNSYISI